MLKKCIIFVALLAAVMLPLSASAEIKEGSFELNPYFGAFIHDGGANLKPSGVLGVRGGYNFTPHIGIEAAIDYQRAKISSSDRVTDDKLHYGIPDKTVGNLIYHVDAIYHFMPEGKFNPYIVGGVGGAHFSPNVSSDRGTFLADIGAGYKYWLTDSTALRLDLRDIYFFDQAHNNVELTVGLVIALGGKGKPAPAPAPEPAPAPKPAPAPAPKPEAKPEPKKEVMPAAAKAEPAPIVLEDVHFDFDKATLTDAAKSILKKNIEVMKANAGVSVRIEGHACQHGADDYNMRLSERRANAVKEYLAKEGGIAESRMTTISYGETRPLCEENPTPKNKNSECMKSNRRVHFEVIVK